ncbi:MAG: cytochrome B [Bacteroidota bacterium]
MDVFILKLHSFLRWALMLLLVVSVVKAAMSLSGKNSYTPGDRKRTLFTMISAHLQLVLGVVLYVTRGWSNYFSNMADTMKNPTLRYWTVEHITMMILAIVFITIGNIRSKKMDTDAGTYKQILIWFGLALLIIIVAMPWPFRLELGRSWF